MPRPKKTPEPAKRGPGRAAKPAPPKAERIHLRLTQEQRAIAERRAARRGGGSTLTTLALEGLLGTDENAELVAWRAGRDAGLREAGAAIAGLAHRSAYDDAVADRRIEGRPYTAPPLGPGEPPFVNGA